MAAAQGTRALRKSRIRPDPDGGRQLSPLRLVVDDLREQLCVPTYKLTSGRPGSTRLLRPVSYHQRTPTYL